MQSGDDRLNRPCQVVALRFGPKILEKELIPKDAEQELEGVPRNLHPDASVCGFQRLILIVKRSKDPYEQESLPEPLEDPAIGLRTFILRILFSPEMPLFDMVS